MKVLWLLLIFAPIILPIGTAIVLVNIIDDYVVQPVVDNASVIIGHTDTDATNIDVGNLVEPVITSGAVTDVERFTLAVLAGFSPQDAVVATAISIAEDGSGNPVALSPMNTNRTYDFCLWQVNSSWWPKFGGQEALANPSICAHAAYVIFTIQGWCAWSTYESSCGAGHNSAYRAALGRAAAASKGTP